MERQKTWIVIGDSSRARCFECYDVYGPWTLVAEFDHPPGRQRAQELVSDEPGRVQQTGSPGMKAAKAPRTDPREVEAARFSRMLAKEIRRARCDGRFGNLVLVAPPHFLGLLESALDEATARLVSQRVGKDFTHLTVAELHERASQL